MSKITITVSGRVGSGKSAICGEIEILCKALGLPVEWVSGQQEKNLVHADWTEALEMYKPEIIIVEQIERSAVVLDDAMFLHDVAAQEPEKPDYWSSCGQCERNIERAQDILEARAASPQTAICATCNGHGMIGGPSYREPDEGGVPCPDCATATQPAQARVLIQEAVRSLSIRADELKVSNISLDGTWCDADEEAAYNAEIDLIERLRALFVVQPASGGES